MQATRPPHTTAGRYCLSCCATLLCWAVWLVLGAILAWQGYVVLAKDVTVPGFVLRRIEATLAAENFSVKFGRAHLDPHGGVLLENVRLHSRTFEDPLLTADAIYVRKSLWSVLAGQPMPDVVQLSGASVRMPAIFSPSGTAEELLGDINAEFDFTGDTWSVKRLTGRIANLNLSVTGRAARPRSAKGTPLSATEITAQCLQYARQAVILLPELQAAGHPCLDVSCTPREAGGMDLRLDLTAASYLRPGNTFELGPLAVSGRWVWDGINPYPLRIQLTTGQLAWPEFSAKQVRANLTLEPAGTPLSLDRLHGEFTAASLQTLGEYFQSPVIAGSFSPVRNQAEWHTAFVADRQVISLGTVVDFTTRSGQVHFAGRVTPALATSMLTRHRPMLEPYFRFTDPAELNVRIGLAPGWKFAGLWSRVGCGRVDSRGVQITSASGRIDVDPELNFHAYDAHVIAGGNEARGAYWMNFRSMDYRFLLTGHTQPLDIAGWLGPWWPAFWQNFAFPAAPPAADVDVAGNWKEKVTGKLTYFGSAETGAAEILGTRFDRVRTRIFLRPQFTHAFDLSGTRAGGTQQVTGWFKRTADPASRNGVGLAFDLTGNLDADSLRRLGGEPAANLLEPWEFTGAPQLHLWGLSQKKNEVTQNNLQFAGQFPAAAKFHHFPLEHVAVAGRLDGEKLSLDQIELQAAGGRIHGQATLDGPAAQRLLRFDLKMENADLARTIRALEEFEAGRTGVKETSSMTESRFIRRASGGKLEIALAAQGNPDTPTLLAGNGTIQLSGAELAEINLFGLLSQVLSFSSLKLDNARSSFAMAEGRVHFPDVRITGKSALIDAKGTYLIDTKALDFTARLKPFEEIHNPLTAVMSLVLNPLTSMFTLQLTGKISDPKWSVELGSSTRPAEPEKTPATLTPATPPKP